MKVTKDNVKVGMDIWAAFDDRPFDGCGYHRGKVTAVFDDHYLFDNIDVDIKNVWGFLDEDDEESSVCNFTTKEDCMAWLKIK